VHTRLPLFLLLRLLPYGLDLKVFCCFAAVLATPPLPSPRAVSCATRQAALMLSLTPAPRWRRTLASTWHSLCRCAVQAVLAGHGAEGGVRVPCECACRTVSVGWLQDAPCGLCLHRGSYSCDANVLAGRLQTAAGDAISMQVVYSAPRVAGVISSVLAGTAAEV
jgi:hypothetical protein